MATYLWRHVCRRVSEKLKRSKNLIPMYDPTFLVAVKWQEWRNRNRCVWMTEIGAPVNLGRNEWLANWRHPNQVDIDHCTSVFRARLADSSTDMLALLISDATNDCLSSPINTPNPSTISRNVNQTQMSHLHATNKILNHSIGFSITSKFS